LVDPECLDSFRYFMKITIYKGKSLFGPYDYEKIQDYLSTGMLQKSDMAWSLGFDDWRSLEEILSAGMSAPLPAEVEDEFNKIIELIKKGEGELAFDIANGLNSVELYEKLLENCCFGKDGSIHLSDLFTRFHGDTALFFKFLAHAPGDAQICSTLKVKNFVSLKFDGDTSFETLDFLEVFNQIKTLEISLCHSLYDFRALSKLSNLHSLKIDECAGLKDLSSLSEISVTNLEIKNCWALHDISALSSMPNLKYLDLSDCSRIKDFSVIPELSNLHDLTLSGCNSIEDPEFFKSLDLPRLKLPNKFFAKIRHVEKFGHLITRDYYITDELLESSPFDSVDDLIDAYEEGTEEWEDFLNDEIRGYYSPDEEDEEFGEYNDYEDWEVIKPRG
jgi:hypothetical protein